MKESAYEKSAIQNPYNICGRFSPKLYLEYVGNAITHAHSSCPIQELYSTVPNGLYLAASAIRKAIDRVDETTARNVYGIFDSLSNMRSARANIELAPGSDSFVITAAANDWYGFERGNHMGRLVRVRYLLMNAVINVTVLLRLRDGGLEVYMGYKREVIKRLKLDETFTTFVELRCY